MEITSTNDKKNVRIIRISVRFSSRSEDTDNFSVDADRFSINFSILSNDSALSIAALFSEVSGLRTAIFSTHVLIGERI